VTREVRNIFPSPEDGDQKVVVIPADYLEKRVAPICIRTIDDKGRPVHRGWIEAARRIAGSLRFFARTILHNEERVSELAEDTVHRLSAKHGDRLGRRPHYRLYIFARWRARIIASGGQRSHDFQREVELPPGMRDGRPDPYDFAKAFENREYFTKVEEELLRTGRPDAAKVIQMYLAGSDHEIPEVFGLPSGRDGYRAKNTFFQRIRRDVREVLESFSQPMEKKKPAA
jgi:hypothetical protein